MLWLETAVLCFVFENKYFLNKEGCETCAWLLYRKIFLNVRTIWDTIISRYSIKYRYI